MSTTSPGDNGVAVSKYLFATAIYDNRGLNGFANMLTDGASMVVDSAEDREQSKPGAPIVMIKDTTKGQDEISVRLYHDLEEPPSIGNEPVKGREERIRSDEFKMRVNYTRKGVVEEAVNELRRPQDLLEMAEIKVKEYMPRWKSEVAKFMLAGGRGTERKGSLMPIDNGEGNLNHYTINGIQPTTFDEHYYGGNGTVGSINGDTAAAINAGATCSFEAIERMTTEIDSADQPLGAVRYEGVSDDIQGLIFLSARGWDSFKQSDSRYVDQLMADAKDRVANFGKHEVFRQKMAMVNNYLVMKYPGKPIRWQGGDQMEVSNDNDQADTSFQIVPDGLFIERAFVLGNQALANMYAATKNAQPFSIEYDSEDYDFRKGVCVCINSAMKKIRLPDQDGRMRDLGVRTMDYAVPR